MKTRTILAIVAVLLALGLIGTGIWGFGLKDKAASLTSANEKMSAEISDLNKLKKDLEAEVDELETAYTNLSQENSDLQTNVEEAEKKVKRREATIRSLRKELAKTNEVANETGSNLRYQITNLMNAKSALETSIRDLQSENDSLRNVAGQLQQDLSKARNENTELASLNKTMDDELARLTLANFKASAFRVEVQNKKGTKVTSKSRRARKLAVSFDLTGVPTEYQGVRPVYLVITDEKATPIKITNPIQAEVMVNGQTMQLQAAEAKEVNIEANQRLSFSHDLNEKLTSGYYRVVAYTDIGLLGATSFRLR